MALVQCGECNAQMSDKATACPQCGAPNPRVPPPAPTPSTIVPNQPAPAKKNGGCGSVVLGLIALIVLVAWLLPDTPRTTSGTPKRTGDGRATPSQPELLLLSMSCDQNSAGAFVTGRVKNVSGRQLKGVRATASFYTSTDTHLGSDDGYIDLQPLLPQQESGFKVYGPRNPSYSKCSVDAFQEGLRGQISWERKK